MRKDRNSGNPVRCIRSQDGRAWSDGRTDVQSTHTTVVYLLAFLDSHSNKHSAYPKSPPHQIALITGAIQHAQKDSGREREREPLKEERRWEGRGGEGEQPHSYCIQTCRSKQINSSCYLPHLARPRTRPGRNTRHSPAVAKEQCAKIFPNKFLIGVKVNEGQEDER